MTAFTDKDLQVLRRLNADKCDAPGHPCTEMARAVADHLRRECPDLGDVDLARVLLAAAAPTTYLAVERHLTGRQTASLIAGAAVDLASLHLD